MEEYNNLFNEFKKMGLDAKRNAYSEEIIKISLILKSYLKKFNIESTGDVYNYISKTDQKLSESDLLDINFKDIYMIKEQLLTLLSIYDSKKNGDYNG